MIYGDYNSASAQQISMRFNFCDDSKRDDCFTEEETKEWLQNKYMILLYRQIRFDPNSFYEDTKIKETRIHYIPISTQSRLITPFKLQQTHLKTQDSELFSLDSWTATTRKDLFTLQELIKKPYERKDNTWMQITIEMDLNRMTYARSRYTALELLAQFGGFIGIFGRIFGFFMAAWNFNALSNYMVTRLYRFRTIDTNSD